MNVLKRWRAVPRTERRALWPAAWRLAMVRVLLATRGTAGAQKFLANRAKAGTRILESPELWQTRAGALQRLSTRMPATRCLARSITLWWWMRASGLAPTLQVGIRQTQPDLQGHAWVECNGHVFGETRDGAASYTMLNWKVPD